MSVVNVVRRALRRLLQGLAEQLRIRLMLFAMWFFPRRAVDGVLLIPLLKTDEHTATFFAKVTAALAIVRLYDPRRYRRVVHLLRRIALVPAGGEYVDTSLATYMMDVPTLVQRTAPSLALKIVHEVAHLRLKQAGIPYAESLRDRIEDLCIRQEIDFAERTPRALGLVEEAKRKLGQRWWDDAALQVRHAQYLAGYPLPSWLRSAVRMMFRLNH